MIFTKHARERLRERGLTIAQIRRFLAQPDKIEISAVEPKRALYKKLYFNERFGRDHLVLMFCEKSDAVVKLITIIDTSKISKYF